MTLELTEADILRIVRERLDTLLLRDDSLRLVVQREPAAAGDTETRVSVVVRVSPYPTFKSTRTVAGAEGRPDG